VVFASGNLDEYRLKALLDAGAPIDGFGVGTSLVTSADASSLDSVYKLMEYAGRPRRKRSEGKATWPGRKQVFRRAGADGCHAGDILTVEGDPQVGEPLIARVMAGGGRVGPSPALPDVRARALAQLAALPQGLRGLEDAAPYPVEVAPALLALAREVDALTR
jgi:nicotinate phosphoribosyltransferase